MRRFGYWWLGLIVRTIGRLSAGIRMSLDIGFTSGKMLDYIYENRPQGWGPLGRWIDAIYLGHQGWRSIRQRKQNLETLLEEALEAQLGQTKSALVVDIASGPAAYIFATAPRFGEAVTWWPREYDQRWVDEGNAKAARLGLPQIQFAQWDAFAPESFAGLTRRPEVIISSGFYDWIKDENLVKGSLDLVAKTLPKGGWFVTTVQTGHVDLEMVNQVFVDFNQNPLDMRTYDPDEFQGWLAERGLIVEKRLADPNGHYTVMKARKA